MTKRKATEQEVVDDQDERYFLNPESVSRHLYCAICAEVFIDPQRAPCGHSFCKVCILQWLKNKELCPEDRKKLRAKDLHHDFILENIIGDQMVACPFRKVGCTHVGQLQLLASHKKSCNFNPKNMPDFLKKESVASLNNSSVTCPEESDTESDDEPLPKLAKPSLKMRLFNAGGEQRDLLCSMFGRSATTSISKEQTCTPSPKTRKRSKNK